MDASVWDSRYGAEEYVYGVSPNVYVQTVHNQRLSGRSLRICELASGEGRNVVFLAKVGDMHE